ncbi:glycosyltransferase family 87 protein [Novosphingobium sp. FKTRR1]|uniref:glycosyltransferase family 87 protein n=1 Tax=Novosphingobium sp. FKTRR1 TaxID=2879118 RepID=UPI001CF04F94|nr:glycosyltransferase family 87 protein [Novosphingobium sp. FKTRR1]
MTAKAAPQPAINPPSEPWWRVLRDGGWPDLSRVRVYAAMVLIAYLPMLAVVFAQATGHVGSDFLAFWGAGHLAVGGHPAQVYDLAAEQAAQALTGTGQLVAFVNPPPFLFATLPLGLLPYGVAWIAFALGGWAIWFAVARKLAPPHLALAVLAFPGAYLAASHAQTGFITGVLLIGGVIALPRRPWHSGALLGALVIKPHLALLVPVWLLAGRQWRALASAAMAAIGLCLAALLAFGWQTWAAWPQAFAVSKVLMAQGPSAFWLRMCTPYAALHQHGGPLVAMVGQAALTLLAAALSALAWRRSRDPQATGAVMLAATALGSPYLFSYDLPFLIQPLCWLATQARVNGWRAWEKPLLVLLWLAPLATRAAALPLGVNLMPLAAAGLLWLVWTRLDHPQHRSVRSAVGG